MQFNKAPKSDILRDDVTLTDLRMREAYAKDAYICQYCGIRVIPKEVLSLYSQIVGRDNFTPTGTNKGRHGVVLAFRANADHVVPRSRGGTVELGNLVTCCWSCNYGKANYTVEEIGIRDPRDRIKTYENWQ